MYSKCWQIIRDDSKKTFEVYSQEVNLNHFTNLVHSMQKAGMTVSCLTPPVSNKNANKSSIQVTGYTSESGLYNRLMKEYNELRRKEFEMEGDF